MEKRVVRNVSLKFVTTLLISIFIAATLLLTLALLVFAAGPYTDWIDYASNPVFHLTKAYYPSILFDGGTYHMWYGDGTTT